MLKFSSFSREFVEFVRRAMGCFSCCFRIRDDHHTQINRFSQPITAIQKERVDPLDRSCVWSLLDHEDEDVDQLSQCEDGSYGVMGSPFLDDELRAEAKFLKACGTLPQTPVEIRKIEKLEDSQPHNGDTESTFNSRLSNIVIEEALEKQPDELQSSITVSQKRENESDSSSNSLENIDGISSNSSEGSGIVPASSTHCKNKSVHFESQSESCSFSSDNSSPNIITKVPLKLYESPFDHTISKPSPYQTPVKLTDDMQTPGCGIVPASSTRCKNKSVHFESQSDLRQFSSENLSPNITKVPLKLYESPFDHTISKPSPYPTPLKLTDDMQTPGTIFPSCGKNTRVRIQYLYSQLDSPIEEECIDQSDKESPQLQVNLQESATKKDLNVCSTLSSWLSLKSNHEAFIDQSLSGQTPGDRPILGVVSDWNADEITPKWGEVNGIPNTTNKYSEDQKVTWHATPFEERLEKVLSEEKFIRNMKKLEESTFVES